MSAPFRTAPFKTTDGTVARSVDQWFGDELNVREFANLKVGGSGVMGDGTVWNGFTNRRNNRPIFIPAGNYRLTTTLDLVKIVGGYIRGAGQYSTRLSYEGAIAGGATITSLLNINGCADFGIGQMSMECPIGTASDNSCIINLNWDGDNSGNGCDGLHHVHLRELHIGNFGQFGVIVANAGNDGRATQFTHVNINGNGNPSTTTVGLDVRGPNSAVHIVGGGGLGCLVWARCPAGGGSLSAKSWSTGQDVGLDFQMSSGGVMHIGQGRSESKYLAKLTSGTLTVHSMTTTGANPVIEINGGKCIVEGNHFVSGEITGTGGQLYLAANYFNGVTTPLSGYSGSVVWNEDGV
jgi:hypothetical protein